jgi:hypothetical protein
MQSHCSCRTSGRFKGARVLNDYLALVFFNRRDGTNRQDDSRPLRRYRWQICNFGLAPRAVDVRAALPNVQSPTVLAIFQFHANFIGCFYFLTAGHPILPMPVPKSPPVLLQPWRVWMRILGLQKTNALRRSPQVAETERRARFSYDDLLCYLVF